MTSVLKITRLLALGSHHGDDFAGWAVADALRDEYGKLIDLRRVSVPIDIMNWLDDVCELHIVDACHGNGSTGCLNRWDWAEFGDAVDSSLHTSGSHDFGVLSVLKLAERLGRIPDKVVIWGIQAKVFGPFESVSADLTEQLPGIVAEIAREWTDA